MDKILEIHGKHARNHSMLTPVLILLKKLEADSDLVCQPGARWMDINDTLKKQGIPLFFPVCQTPQTSHIQEITLSLVD